MVFPTWEDSPASPRLALALRIPTRRDAPNRALASPPWTPRVTSSPRLVDYISSLQGLVRLGDLADLEPDKSVVVVVSGCYPLEDAPILFDDLSARETWCVIGMPELCILRARAISLLQRREDLRALVRDMGHDLLVCGTESGKVEEFSRGH